MFARAVPGSADFPQSELGDCGSPCEPSLLSGRKQRIAVPTRPVGTNPSVRSVMCARPFTPAAGLSDSAPIRVYASPDMAMFPRILPGTAPIATPSEIFLVLGDFRGDIWLMDHRSPARCGRGGVARGRANGLRPSISYSYWALDWRLTQEAMFIVPEADFGETILPVRLAPPLRANENSPLATTGCGASVRLECRTRRWRPGRANS